MIWKKLFYLNFKTLSFISIFFLIKTNKMYYIAKIEYLTNLEGGDKLKKKSENFMINALSVTEAEAKIVEWIPANWQDPKLKGVNQSSIVDINWGTDEEKWFKAKVSYMDGDDRSKPFQVVIEAIDIRSAINQLEKLYTASWISEISETNIVVDLKLIEDKNVSTVSINN